MSDLISRSELIKELNKYCGNQRYLVSENIREIINNQPNAYDLDKVVEELKTDSSIKLYGSQNSDNYLIPVKRAIEIVNQCGVADDVCEWKLEDKEANLYLTGCHQRQLIFEGTPKENGYRYCPYCGKKIKIVGD